MAEEQIIYRERPEASEDIPFLANSGMNPLVNFNFMLRVEAVTDVPCKSVHSFSKNHEYEYIQEGGLNDYVHMKRKPISQPFTFQVERYVGIDYIDPLPNGTELLLPLLLFVSRKPGDFAGDVIRCYTFTGCTVMGKEYGELSSETSGLLTETSTIAYRELLVVNIPLGAATYSSLADLADSPAVVAREATTWNVKEELAKSTVEVKEPSLWDVKEELTNSTVAAKEASTWDVKEELAASTVATREADIWDNSKKLKERTAPHKEKKVWDNNEKLKESTAPLKEKKVWDNNEKLKESTAPLKEKKVWDNNEKLKESTAPHKEKKVWDNKEKLTSSTVDAKDPSIWDLDKELAAGAVDAKDPSIWDLDKELAAGAVDAKDPSIWDVPIELAASYLEPREPSIWDVATELANSYQKTAKPKIWNIETVRKSRMLAPPEEKPARGSEYQGPPTPRTFDPAAKLEVKATPPVRRWSPSE